jgi:threonine dehydrogenase-like Zn-dependent dehydrogenase
MDQLPVAVFVADGTLVKLPVAADSALMPSLLTLSDVFGTGLPRRCRGRRQRTHPRHRIGDGAVGLLAVLSAKRLGAEQIILMGRHKARTDLGREFGVTDVVSARGEEGIAQVRELTGGHGTHVVLEAVGHMPAYEQALGVVRPGGVISRVGVPQYEEAPIGMDSLFRHNLRLAGGPAPVRAYIEELMPDILDGAIEPGKVFDTTTDLDGVPAGYQDMADRKSLRSSSSPDAVKTGERREVRASPNSVDIGDVKPRGLPATRSKKSGSHRVDISSQEPLTKADDGRDRAAARRRPLAT